MEAVLSSIILLPNERLMFLANVIYLLNTGAFEHYGLSIVSPLDELNDTTNFDNKMCGLTIGV